MFKQWINSLRGKSIDWDELEATLIQSDLGIDLAMRIMDRLQSQSLDSDSVEAAAVEELSSLWSEPVGEPSLIDGMNIWLIVGVNGVGKTTSIAKLSHSYQSKGRKVHLVAGDTFRAGAIEQLRIWSERLGTGFTGGNEGGDAAAAAHQGIAAAKDAGADMILVDTAGRLHNNDNLMREMEKVRRVIANSCEGAPHLTLQVIDGTSGSNAVQQVEKFHGALKLDGLIVSKLDSSARGGAVAAIKEAHDLSPYYIGTGETVDDLKPFEPESYVRSFFTGAGE